MRRGLTFAFAIAAMLAVLIGTQGYPTTAHATQTTQNTPNTTRGSWLVQLSQETSDPKAVEIASKLYNRELTELRKLGMGEARVYARFVSLAPGKPQTSVAASIVHPAICGSHQCQTLLFEHLGSNRYRIVLDVVMDQFYLNASDDGGYYQILVPDPMGTKKYAVWVMDTQNKAYKLKLSGGAPRLAK